MNDSERYYQTIIDNYLSPFPCHSQRQILQVIKLEINYHVSLSKTRFNFLFYILLTMYKYYSFLNFLLPKMQISTSRPVHRITFSDSSFMCRIKKKKKKISRIVQFRNAHEKRAYIIIPMMVYQSAAKWHKRDPNCRVDIAATKNVTFCLPSPREFSGLCLLWYVHKFASFFFFIFHSSNILKSNVGFKDAWIKQIDICTK